MITNPLSATRWRRRAAVLAVAVATLALAAAPAQARPVLLGTGRDAAAAASVIPRDCSAHFGNAPSGEVAGWELFEGRLQQTRLGTTILFGGQRRVPRAMTSTGQETSPNGGVDAYFLAVVDDSLWQVRYPATVAGSELAVKRISTGGWQGVRHLTTSGRRVYALNDTGGLLRYSVSNTAGTVRRTGAVATSGWQSVISLAPAPRDDDGVDRFIGNTTSGSLVEYTIRRSDRAVRRDELRSTGWSRFTQVVAGSCGSSTGRPILGVTPGGRVLGHYDRNVGDGCGDDIVGPNVIGRGFTGLVFQ
ncbi:MAG: hypothetical protein ACRCY8_12610 [Dermatophilaceae bacterium]